MAALVLATSISDRKSGGEIIQVSPAPTATASHQASASGSLSPIASPAADRYASALLGLSFTLPRGWYAREDSGLSRVYVSNFPGTYDLPDRPVGWEQVWLSGSATESSATSEAHTKAGFPDCCSEEGAAAVPVMAGSILAGSVSIDTYEFQSDMQAYWTYSGNRYSGTVSTPTDNQPNEVAILKALLATVTPAR